MSLLYASDHDEFLPPVFTFQPGAGNGEKLLSLLAPYEGGEALHCPSDEPEFRRKELSRVEGTGKLGYVHDQGLSAFFRSAGQVQLINLSKVPDPSKVLFFRDPIRSIQTKQGGVQVGSPHGEYFVGSHLDGSSTPGLRYRRGNFSRFSASTRQSVIGFFRGPIQLNVCRECSLDFGEFSVGKRAE